MRQMAEFENFRKRSEKEKSAMFETGAKSVIEKILPVVEIILKEDLQPYWKTKRMLLCRCGEQGLQAAANRA